MERTLLKLGSPERLLAHINHIFTKHCRHGCTHSVHEFVKLDGELPCPAISDRDRVGF